MGAQLQQKEIDEIKCWTITSYDYVKAAVQTIETALTTKSWKLPTKVTTPMSTVFIPELDGTDELNE